MGWTWQEKPHNIKDYFNEQLTWENPKVKRTVLKSALVTFNTYYAAVEHLDKATGISYVFAVVSLLQYNHNDYYNFGYKDLDETCGPNEVACPKSILKLLTPTEHEYANNWRTACWERHARLDRASGLKDGDKVEFKYPISFGAYGKFTELYVNRVGKKLRFAATPHAYEGYLRITKSHLASAMV